MKKSIQQFSETAKPLNREQSQSVKSGHTLVAEWYEVDRRHRKHLEMNGEFIIMIDIAA